MWNRIPALLLVVGVVAGYAVRGTDVTAQAYPQGVPLAAGDTVTLVYQQLQPQAMPLTEECAVMELRGTFVRCMPQKNSRQAEEWRNLTFVVGIAKHEK